MTFVFDDVTVGKSLVNGKHILFLEFAWYFSVVFIEIACLLIGFVGLTCAALPSGE